MTTSHRCARTIARNAARADSVDVLAVQTAEFQAILDQSSAPWWQPDTLWTKAKDRTAAVFADYHPGAGHALLGEAA